LLTTTQKDEVLRFIAGLQSHSFTFREVVRYLELDSDDRRSLQRFLDELDDQEVIHRIKRGRYALPARENLVSGLLNCHRDGYGFVAPDDRSILKEDIFVPGRNMGEALHGDRVLIKVARKKAPERRGGKRRSQQPERQERLEGSVVRVLERKFPNIIGRYYEHPRFPFVVPVDARMLHDIRIPFHASKAAKNGQIVVLALTVPPGRYQNPEGRVVEVLGYPGDQGIEYRIVQYKFGLPVQFSSNALREAEALPNRVLEEESVGREDFRDEIAVTIDGETARDFDDAVSLKKLPNGHYLLGVHIADVSHYVRENSALDREAFDRGTSIYFPDRAIPMLPPKLSSGICSLKPNEDRLVFSVLMEVDGRGDVVSKRFSKGMMRSRNRMTYVSVAKVLLESDPREMEKYADLIPLFQTMQELCLILAKKRYRRGSVDFDLPEAEMEFDAKGRVIRVVPAERNISHRIIEEFMLLANEAVAERLATSGGPGLYRIHEKPDPLKVDDFATFALSLGYRLENSHGEYSARDFQKFVEKLEGKIEGRFLAYLMLRSFMQARYSEINLGHFALAAERYTHFTSPIRRYPDLVVHRLLNECLKEQPSHGWQEQITGLMPSIALHTTARERNADEAEREIEKIKKVQFMSDKVGDEFEAIVLSVIPQGFFVELLEHFVEGFVPVGTLTDDFYSYKEKTHSFVGDRHHKHFKLGTKVLVRLDAADMESNRLTFSVIELLRD